MCIIFLLDMQYVLGMYIFIEKLFRRTSIVISKFILLKNISIYFRQFSMSLYVSAFFESCQIVRWYNGKTKFRPSTNISTQKSTTYLIQNSFVVEIFVGGRNFCRTGFPPDCHTKVRSCKSQKFSVFVFTHLPELILLTL